MPDYLRHFSRRNQLKSILLLGVVLYAGQAAAYVDPGTGGMLLQLLLGGVAGLAMVMKLYWEKISFTARRLMGKAPADAKQPATEPKSE
jgi:hypothetical protein